ncbi:hypothetical protein CBR_g34675 [Chara braunii]|uniref:Peptidase S59 domain-containing protein n=1 Tax=Chara braunii TaxID=69332 RepID=A0A388JYT6_CHABU|nr:hypothetical protein CBR_g34675 [Chara braunii]|eukprot:GBG62974.1 hypothetical protein CBR_g34675 [Chara braunii]
MKGVEVAILRPVLFPVETVRLPGASMEEEGDYLGRIAKLPKLRNPEYYIEPDLCELAAKERTHPGHTACVQDFVVGRRCFGSLKFLGPTDVRGLDLDDLVQFNEGEVLVYMNGGKKKPPVGKGLNKAAEVTLLNIRCIEKTSEEVLKEGPAVERFVKKLMEKTKEQGAEFIDYDRSEGIWVFRVKHFSRYGLDDSDEDDDEQQHVDDRIRKGKAPLAEPDRMDVAEDGAVADRPDIPRMLRGMDIEEDEAENGRGEFGGFNHKETEADVMEEGLTSQQRSTLAHSLPMQLRLDPVRMQQMKHLLFPLDEEEGEGRKRVAAGDVTCTRSRRGKVAGGGGGGDGRRATNASPSQQQFSSQRRDSHQSWVSPNAARRPTEVPLSNAGVSLSSPSMANRLVPTDPQSEGQSPPMEGTSRSWKRPRVDSSGFSLTSPVIWNIGRSGHIANAGLFLGRSFRVGWGPNGILVHAGNPTGKVGISCAVSSKICVEKVSLDRTSRDENGAKRDELMDLQFVEPLVWHKSMSRRVVEQMEGTPASSLHHALSCGSSSLAYTCQRYEALLEKHASVSCLSDADRLVLCHQKMIWDLIDALFSEIRLPAEEESEEAEGREDGNMLSDDKFPKDEAAEKFQRRAYLSTWIQRNVRSTIEREFEDRDSPSDSDASMAIFTHLSGRQLEEATGRAISAGDFRLATLLSQAGVPQNVRTDNQLQLKLWEETGTSKNPAFIEPGRLAIYRLLAGDMEGTLPEMQKMDWKRQLGLVIWHMLQAGCPLDVIIKQYRQLVENGQGNPPVPLYVEKAGAADFPLLDMEGGNACYDMAYHLLILFSGDESAAIDARRMLQSATWTFDRLDHRLSWHVHSVLEALGAVSDPNLHALHMDFAAQLMGSGLCEWAIYVVLNMRLDEKDAHLHEAAVKEILCMSCEDWIPSKEKQDFFRDLGIPDTWLHAAQVIYWRYRQDSEKEIAHLLLSEQWQAAHKLLVSTVAPKLFLGKRHDVLQDYVSQLEPHKDEIECWEEGAALYLEYYMLRASVLEGSPMEEQLAASQALFDLVRRVVEFSKGEPKENHVVCMTIAQSAVELLMKGVPSSKLADVHHLALEAPLTEDNRVCHVQGAVLQFASWLSEGVA